MRVDKRDPQRTMRRDDMPAVGIAERMGWWAWEEYESVTPSPEWMDTPGGWMFCAFVGVVVLTTLLHLARGLVGVHAPTAKALLVART